ncbi:MAG: hypothetical protein WDW38_005593 [Sanguina aurantia]
MAEMLRVAQAQLNSCPAATIKDLSWDGRVRGYSQGKADCSLCVPVTPPAVMSAGTAAEQPGIRQSPLQQHHRGLAHASLLEQLLHILAAAAASSHAAADLMRLDVQSLLQRLCLELTPNSDPIAAAVQAVYHALASASQDETQRAKTA